MPENAVAQTAGPANAAQHIRGAPRGLLCGGGRETHNRLEIFFPGVAALCSCGSPVNGVEDGAIPWLDLSGRGDGCLHESEQQSKLRRADLLDALERLAPGQQHFSQHYADGAAGRTEKSAAGFSQNPIDGGCGIELTQPVPDGFEPDPHGNAVIAISDRRIQGV